MTRVRPDGLRPSEVAVAAGVGALLVLVAGGGVGSQVAVVAVGLLSALVVALVQTTIP